MYKFDKRDLVVFLVCDLFKTNEKLAHCMENCQRLNTYKNHRYILLQVMGYINCMYDLGRLDDCSYEVFSNQLIFLLEVLDIEEGIF